MDEIVPEPRLKLRCQLSIPKDERYRNEDNLQSSDRLGIYALSDGASVSFDSASWSQILVRRFARFPHLDQQWMEEAITEFEKLHKRDGMDWIQQAAFERGSFASLLAVRYEKSSETLKIIAIGDSMAVLCDGNEIKATFPYCSPEEFDSDPLLLSTKAKKNDVFDDEKQLRKEYLVECSIRELTAPALFCMTDALGRWCLEQHDAGETPVEILRTVAQQSRKKFTTFVEVERSARRMKYDDTSLLALW